MAENIQIKINAAVEGAQAAKTIGQLRRSLEELQELAENSDLGSEQFQQLQKQIVETNGTLAAARDRVGDIQDKISTLEGTPVERLTSSFGLLRDSIFSLDFDKAKIGVEGLVNSFTPLGPNGEPLKGLKAMGPVLRNLGTGVLQLGKTFISLGRALLTNPIFLLATIIATIAVSITALLNKLGLLKPIFDTIAKAVGFVTDAFNSLTQAIGLTTAASDEHLKRVSENAEKERQQIEETSRFQVAAAQALRDLNSLQIRDIEKVTGFYLQQGQTVETTEKRKQEALMKSFKQEIDRYKETEKANGKLNEKQQEKLKELVKAYDDAAIQIINIERGRIASIEQAERENEQARINAIENRVERAEAQAKFEKDIANQTRDDIAILRQEEIKLNKEAIFAQGKDRDKLLKEAELRRREINALTQKRQRQEAEADRKLQQEKEDFAKENEEKRKAREQKRLDDLKKSTKEELDLLEELLDIAVLKTKEGTKERLDAEIDRIQKVEDFTRKNAKILEITENQLEITRLKNIEEISKKREEFAEKEAELDFKKLETLKQIEVLSNQKSIVYYKNEIKRIEALKDLENFYLDESLKNNKLSEEEKIKLRLESNNKINLLDKEIFDILNGRLDQLQAEDEWYYDYLERKKQEELQSTLTIDSKKVDIVKNSEKEKLSALENTKFFEIDAAKERARVLGKISGDEANAQRLLKLDLLDIDKRYTKKRVEIEKKSSDEIKAIRQEEAEIVTNLSTSGINSVQSLSDAVFAIKMRNLKKGSKEEEKAARQQFNINKALQVGLAIIDGFKAANASLAQAPVAIGAVPNPVGIASLAFAITTAAANVTKILAQKFQSTSVSSPAGSSGPSIPQSSGLSPNLQAGQFTAPQFFGLGQERQTTSVGPNQQRVYVVETDIRRVANNVAVIEDRAVFE